MNPTFAKLMDKMAMAVDSPRREHRLRDIRQAWCELANYLHMPWWKRILIRIKGV